MVEFFISQMKANSDLFKEPTEKNKQDWCKDIKLIIDKDLKEKDADRTKRFTILKELIIHSCNKPFYSKNIRSTKKLRERLGELADDLKDTRLKQNGKNSYNNYNTNQAQPTNQYKDVDVNSLYQGGEWE